MLGSSVLPLVANILAHKVSYKANYFNIIKCILLVPNLRPPRLCFGLNTNIV